MQFTNEHLTRQLDLLPIDKLGEPITIIGVGAIGSFACLSLAKMGFSNITVFDFDSVDVVNLNSQFYRRSDIGKPKVVALAEIVKDFTGVEIVARHERYTGGTFAGIVLACADSMETRRLIWEQHSGVAAATRCVIDSRMGAEVALLYSYRPMNMDDCESYKKTLHTDEQGVRESCTAKATCYTATMLAGLACKCVKDLVVLDKSLKTVQWSIKDAAWQSWWLS